MSRVTGCGLQVFPNPELETRKSKQKSTHIENTETIHLGLRPATNLASWNAQFCRI